MTKETTKLPRSVGIVKFMTAHAFERWMERTGSTSKSRALTNLTKHLERAEEVELSPKYQALALLNHDLKPARYLRADGWVFVVSTDGGLITIHSGAAKRWVPVGTKPSPRRSRRRPR